MQSVTFLMLLLSLSTSALGSVVYSKPIYPAEALTAGLEGYVDLIFFVDENCELIVNVEDAQPKGVFEESAISFFKKSITSEEEDIDWSKIPGLKEPDGSVISIEDYEVFRKAIQNAGPWPLLRIHRFTKETTEKVECHITSTKQLDIVEVYREDNLIRRINGTNIQTGENLYGPDSWRITYQIDE